MFDTMTLTKAVGAFCGAFLIFLLGGFVGELIYHGGGGHGEGHEQAYSIEVADAGAGGEGEAAVPFEELLAAADAAEGEKLFRQCSACHKLDGTDATGPHLNGVVGRAVASVAGFSYSGALAPVADTWTPENLAGFIEAPSKWAPGTAMSYRGMGDAEDRANLIAFLATQQ